MAEFKDRIPHTGGQLTIRKQGTMYQLEYVHQNFNRMALVELVALDGEPVEWINMVNAMSAGPRSKNPPLRIEFPTDAEAMWGRSCPKCKSYFRAAVPYTELCPYCDNKADSFDFLTGNQRAFIKKQYDAIITAMAGPDGDTTMNFESDDAESWVYSEEKQQTHFECAKCEMEFDVLGDYVRCPQCGTRTTRQVIERRLTEIAADFEHDAANILKEQRDHRQRRWRHHVTACVAEFEVCARDVTSSLASLPSTPRRRRAISELSLLSLISADENLRDWYGLELLTGIDQGDRAFVNTMFNRRHLFAHTGGRVDQEYLDKTGDATVRLNEVLTIDSGAVRRLIALLRQIARNLLDGRDSIT
jgi:uncharacterized C2H2 Zn-finger protein